LKLKVIGLTGGIGSGKSTVSCFLAGLGAVIVDTDKVGHETFEPGSGVWQQIVAAFGQQVVTVDGSIDRIKLGELVFNNPEARLRLEEITHPAIYELVKERLAEYERQMVAVVMLEVPLLIEAGWTTLVDQVWVTAAPEATILKRLRERAGLSDKESLARIRVQLSSEERIKHADVVIDTNCTLDELQTKVKKLWQELQS